MSLVARSDDYPGTWPRRQRTVQDVMTTPVITADRLTPYKEIARLLAEHALSGLPVLRDGWQVVGVVTESDLLAAQDQAARRVGLTAGELMTGPPVVIAPDATIPAAVRAMNKHHLRRLPVTGTDRQLIGIVSRRDVLSLYLRPDTDIARDVRQVLAELLMANPASLGVTVRHGVVTVAGDIEITPTGSHRPHRCEPVPSTVRLIGDIDGVVQVVTSFRPADESEPPPVPR
jgi:CBS domain-containing protein